MSNPSLDSDLGLLNDLTALQNGDAICHVVLVTHLEARDYSGWRCAQLGYASTP